MHTSNNKKEYILREMSCKMYIRPYVLTMNWSFTCVLIIYSQKTLV